VDVLVGEGGDQPVTVDRQNVAHAIGRVNGVEQTRNLDPRGHVASVEAPLFRQAVAERETGKRP
jgi:hypothetical protein